MHCPLARAKQRKPLVIASYLDAGSIPRYTDIQGVTQQIAESMNDPLQGAHADQVPRWLQPPLNVKCQGSETSSAYLFEQPTDTSPLSNAFASTSGLRSTTWKMWHCFPGMNRPLSRRLSMTPSASRIRTP